MPSDPVTSDMRLEADRPPAELDTLGQALWFDAKGDWAKAHQLAAASTGPDAAWLHAYLHRKEGDAGNARYWYTRAGTAVRTGPLDAEWVELATKLAVVADPRRID